MKLIKELKFKYKSFLTTNQVRNAKAIWQKQKLKKDHLPRLTKIIKDNFDKGEGFPSNVYIEIIKNSRADVDGFCGKYLWDAMTEAGIWEDDNPKYWGKYSVEDNKAESNMIPVVITMSTIAGLLLLSLIIILVSKKYVNLIFFCNNNNSTLQ